MFRKMKKWLNNQLLIFLEARIEIEQLREERDFWKKEANLWISKYSGVDTMDLELLNIKNFLIKETNHSFVNRKSILINSK